MRLSLAPWLGVALLAAPVLTTAQPAPALGDALKTLLNGHPAAAAARQQVVAAEAQARAADRPLYNPELDVEYERAEVNTTTVGVSQTVDWADKRAASAGVGARALAAARAELDRVRQQIALSWLRALSQKAAADATQALAERRRKLAERFVNLAQRRHTAGDLRRSDLNLARLAVLQARVEERQASAGLAAARGELQDAAGGVPGLESPPLGRVPPAPAALESELDRLPQPPPALRTARAGFETARARVDVARRARRPDPTLTLRGGQEGSEALTAVGVSVPLFIRNSFRDEVVAAGAQASESEYRLRALEQALTARLRSRLRAYEAAYAAQQSWIDAGGQLLTEQERLIQRLLELGSISASDYLVQLTQALEIRAQGMALRRQSWSAFLDWLETSGQLQSWLAGDLGR